MDRHMRKLLLLVSLVVLLPAGMYSQTGTGGGLFSDNAGGFTSVAFAGLGTPTNSKVRYCTNCNQGTFPCTGGAGTGSFAFRIGSAWECPSFGAAEVPATRTISTTSPLGGGGDLSADRTFTCTTCATSANNLSFFATTSSAQFLALLNDETGSGLVVFNNGPTLIAPILGTPASGVMTNVTGTAAGLTAGTVTTNANLTGPITSTGNATAIASQTGTGTKFVMDASPTIVTPTIASFTNATHTHQNAAGGGTLVDAAIIFTAPALGAPTATSVTTPIIKPTSDSTTAFKLTKSDGSTSVATFDTTNGRAGFGNVTPQKTLHVLGSLGAVAAFPTLGASDNVVVENNGNSNIALVYGAASIGSLNFFKSGDAAVSGRITYTASTDAMSFYTAGVLKFVISTGGDVTIVGGGNSTGQCTLNGGATATCTHTVPSGCIPVCTYNSSTTPHTISCAVSSTTLTAVSATTLDGGVVNYHCF